jgi:hypothetical protein
VAAVADARAIDAPPPARVSLPGHKGKRARLRLSKLALDGFEKVEQLLPVIVLEDGQRLALEEAHALLSGELGAVAQLPLGAAIADEALQDALDELLFERQQQLTAAEQQRFERALLQAERFIEDRMLVLKTKRNRLQERSNAAQRSYDASTGAQARNEAQAQLTQLQLDLDVVEASLEKLAQRDDARFRAFQDHIHQRRYAPPRVTPLFDLELVFE